MSQTSNQLRIRYFKALTPERRIELRAACSPTSPKWQQATPIHMIGVTQFAAQAEQTTKGQPSTTTD